ncbi:hypothetical protein ARMGADRAFT_1082624 [Armillaria gallica]|uniref:F-box domain-containing protein n=1 Tax=Armillaria gallica TaxID=47427 RepID=A0A2H3D8A7_ARMGA|nr:hypothetical protein ARMGADRAFT_1082624 [Armillaria gallica]
MANSNLSQCTHFSIQKLPPELVAETLSYLTVAEIKPLSLTCTMLNNDCFPFVFRNFSLHGDHRPAPKFFATSKTEHRLNEDISKEILPWSTRVRNAKFKGGPLGNLTILPSLKLLQVLELAYIAAQSRREYFEILSTIPLSVKDLSLRDNTFLDSSLLLHPVTHRIEVEGLHISLLTDLSSLLEDDCPISLRSLRLTSISHPEPQELRDLVERNPLLIDLTILIRDAHAGNPIPGHLALLDYESDARMGRYYLGTCPTSVP